MVNIIMENACNYAFSSTFYKQSKKLLESIELVDRSKNSSRKDGISHKIGDHKHQFRRKDLGGSNLLSRITANRGSLFSHHNYKIRISKKIFFASEKIFFFARLFCLVVVRSRN